MKCLAICTGRGTCLACKRKPAPSHNGAKHNAQISQKLAQHISPYFFTICALFALFPWELRTRAKTGGTNLSPFFWNFNEKTRGRSLGWYPHVAALFHHFLWHVEKPRKTGGTPISIIFPTGVVRNKCAFSFSPPHPLVISTSKKVPRKKWKVHIYFWQGFGVNNTLRGGAGGTELHIYFRHPRY